MLLISVGHTHTAHWTESAVLARPIKDLDTDCVTIYVSSLDRMSVNSVCVCVCVYPVHKMEYIYIHTRTLTYTLYIYIFPSQLFSMIQTLVSNMKMIISEISCTYRNHVTKKLVSLISTYTEMFYFILVSVVRYIIHGHR